MAEGKIEKVADAVTSGPRGGTKTLCRGPDALLRVEAVPVLSASAVLALCLIQFLLCPVVGLANNGDFDRLLAMVGLRSTGPGFAVPYAWLHYSVGHAHAPGGTYLTSYLPIGWLMSGVAHILPGGSFDSRVLATFLAVLLAICVYLVVKAVPGQAARVAAGVVLVIGLCDSRLVAYLDSWYDEPWSLLLLLSLTIWLLQNRGARAVSRRSLIVLIVIAALLITSKTQNAVLVVPMVGAVIVVTRHQDRASLVSRLRPAALPCLLLVAVAVTFVASQSSVYASDSRYDLIFDDLLLHVHDPVATLKSLGLPASMSAYAGTNAYQTSGGYETMAFKRFESGDPNVRIANFFITHPVIAADAVGRGLRAGWQADLPYLGYRTAASGAPPWAGACEPCVYSTVTGAASPGGAPLTIALYGGALLVAVPARRRLLTGAADALVCLCAISATALLAAVFGEGHYEEIKHLYLFYTTNLILLALSLAVSADLIRRRATGPLSKADRTRRTLPAGRQPSRHQAVPPTMR